MWNPARASACRPGSSWPIDSSSSRGAGLLVQLQQLGLDLRVEEHRVGGRDELGELLAARLVGEHGLVGVEDVEERLGGEQGQLAQRRPVDAGGEQGACPRSGSRRLPRRPRAPGAGPSASAPPSAGAARPSPGSGGRRGSARSRSVSMSLAASMRPSTCTTSGSSKTRTTWQIASDSRMLARNLLPSPAPSEAPLTMPAMSTNDTTAGTVFAELWILGQHVEPGVGQRDDADVGLDGGERVVGGEHVVAGQRVEQGRLADVGQADDAEGEGHGGPG